MEELESKVNDLSNTVVALTERLKALESATQSHFNTLGLMVESHQKELLVLEAEFEAIRVKRATA